MVGEEHEDFAVFIALKYLAIASVGRLSHHYVEEVLRSDIVASVVNSLRVVNVGPIRGVENLALDWVIDVMSNVIHGKKDDVFLWHSVLGDNIVGVVCIGLMTVIPKAARTRHNDSPVVAWIHGKSGCRN